LFCHSAACDSRFSLLLPIGEVCSHRCRLGVERKQTIGTKRRCITHKQTDKPPYSATRISRSSISIRGAGCLRRCKRTITRRSNSLERGSEIMLATPVERAFLRCRARMVGIGAYIFLPTPACQPCRCDRRAWRERVPPRTSYLSASFRRTLHDAVAVGRFGVAPVSVSSFHRSTPFATSETNPVAPPCRRGAEMGYRAARSFSNG
jgi:hypothetical protein